MAPAVGEDRSTRGSDSNGFKDCLANFNRREKDRWRERMMKSKKKRSD
jgi:hypothetical protein